ncbi:MULTISPECIES: hypothetical protein [unclassified Amycolatopsis]|uniref:hypothetical protein n=1 Tax=unclassified Amycolatopsis TaxID=2618356 RepID=UPI002876E2EE|nr:MULTISPECIES: hypothetical protein [unclassified Amycolatopsis]MDS0140564.1 hypothetical protein [Amycolatopsis sp. 505]MDS0149214.1 hypothetical protein [Amycolatopsis sp. CM201R]
MRSDVEGRGAFDLPAAADGAAPPSAAAGVHALQERPCGAAGGCPLPTRNPDHNTEGDSLQDVRAIISGLPADAAALDELAEILQRPGWEWCIRCDAADQLVLVAARVYPDGSLDVLVCGANVTAAVRQADGGHNRWSTDSNLRVAIALLLHEPVNGPIPQAPGSQSLTEADA